MGAKWLCSLKLFKALIRQAWHNLSDEWLEEALRVRLVFMVISGLEQVPDYTTLCQFRNLLTKLTLWDSLLSEESINKIKGQVVAELSVPMLS